MKASVVAVSAVAAILALGGVARVAAVDSPSTLVGDPAGCVVGATDTVCTVPHQYVTETQTATATVSTTATATATATVTFTPSPVTVTATVTASPTPTATPTATAAPAAKKLIGMSAPVALWDQRVADVGSCGLEARRIFGDLTSTGLSKESLIREAVADGMLPVVSYKVPSVTTAGQGGYDAWAQKAAAFLDSLGVPVAVTIWHEPNGDMTGPQYVAMSERLLPIFDRGLLKVGPIFNGFLIDTASAKATLETFTSPTLWATWDYFGYDTYDGPNRNPADRIDPLIAFAAAHNRASIPQLIGEYNGIDAAAIKEVGDKVLAAPTFWVALLWNTDADASIGATHLSGDRLAAYQATKADARALHQPAC